jgi:hypothetical protein
MSVMGNLAHRLWSSRDSVFLLALLGCSLSLNSIVAYRLLVPRGAGGGYARGRLQPGTRVPAIEVTDLDGAKVQVRWSDDPRPTVLYVFSPTCIWCARNVASITKLAAAREREYRFIGLSLSAHGVRELVQSTGIVFPVYTNPPNPLVAALKLGSTPETLIVTPGGVVVRTFYGAYAGPVKQEVEAAFSVQIPGAAAGTGL